MPDEILEKLKSFNLIILFMIVLIIFGFISIIFLGNDNPIEQRVEKIIETETGVKLDLSP